MGQRTSDSQDRIRHLTQSLEKLLDLSETSLDGLDLPGGVRYSVLAGITSAAHAHVSAIIALTGRENTWSAEVVLRTLLEGWLIAQYVVADDTDARAAGYVIKSLNETLKFLKRIRRLAQNNPRDEGRILGPIGISSLQECDSRIDELAERVNGIRKRHGAAKLPSMEECARTLGQGAQRIYASLYAFLFSDQVHVGLRTTFAFLKGAAPEAAKKKIERMYKIVLTAYALLLDLLKLTSAHLGQPDSESIEKCERQLQSFAEGIG